MGVSFDLKWVFCRKHMYGPSFLIHSAIVYLLIGGFNPFAFQIIIDRYVFIPILLFIFLIFFNKLLYCSITVVCIFSPPLPPPQPNPLNLFELSLRVNLINLHFQFFCIQFAIDHSFHLESTYHWKLILHMRKLKIKEVT